MAKVNGESYRRGLRDGRTEATLESVAESIDELRESMSRVWGAIGKLPCSEYGALIRGNRLWLRLQWGIFGIILGGLVTVLVFLLRKGG